MWDKEKGYLGSMKDQSNKLMEAWCSGKCSRAHHNSGHWNNQNDLFAASPPPMEQGTGLALISGWHMPLALSCSGLLRECSLSGWRPTLKSQRGLHSNPLLYWLVACPLSFSWNKDILSVHQYSQHRTWMEVRVGHLLLCVRALLCTHVKTGACVWTPEAWGPRLSLPWLLSMLKLWTWSSPIQVGYLANELQGCGCLHKPPISAPLLGLQKGAT